jgi:hypothetical protein
MRRNFIAKNSVHPAKSRIVIEGSVEPSSLNALTRQLHSLSNHDLEEMKDIIDALLLSRRQIIDTEEEPPETPCTADSTLKPGIGHIELKMIPDKETGKSYGPYRYLRYWSQGRLRTRYLGKA